MNFRARRVLPILPLALLACGSPPPAAPAAPLPVATQEPPKEPPVDVSPVPEPSTLVAFARVKSPDAMMKVFGGWTHLPLPSGREMVRSVSTDALADVVDLSQPVDGALLVALSRHGMESPNAFSVGVKSFDEAKTRLTAHHKVEPVANGGLKVHGLLEKARHSRRAEADDGDDDENVCILAHAAPGGQSAKLVCGSNSAVDQLAPYMSRTLPRQSWPSDIHLEVHPDAVRAPISEMRGMLPMLAKNMLGTQSPAMRDLIDASIGEGLDVLDDSQKLTFDGTAADAGVTATTRFEFQGNKSAFSRALTDASRADVAPAAFWHLPSDTDTAFFTRGSEPKLYDHLREILTNLLMEGMTDAKMPESEQKAVHDLVADKMLKLFTDGSTGIYAKGYDQPAVDKLWRQATAIDATDWAKRMPIKRQLGEQIIGWHLYQIGEPVAKVGPILKDWSALWARPAFAKWFETRTDTKAKEMPKMRITPAPAGVTLPKDTIHLEVSIPVDDEQPPMVFPNEPNRPGQPLPKQPKQPKPIPQKPVTLHVFAVPDGANTWLAFGVDTKLVETKVAAALSTAPDRDTLKNVSGLDAFKEKNNGGMFATIRGFLVLTALDFEAKSPFGALGTLSDKGGTPMVFTNRAEAPGANTKGGAAQSQVKVDRQVIEDIVKLVFASQ